MAKISKKVVGEYRQWAKMQAVLVKTLKWINLRIAALEEKMLESVNENGPQAVDGLVAEKAIKPGKTGVEYKAAYLEAYKLLTKAQKVKMDAFLESVTKAPVPAEYVKVTDSMMVLFDAELKSQDAYKIANALIVGVAYMEKD